MIRLNPAKTFFRAASLAFLLLFAAAPSAQSAEVGQRAPNFDLTSVDGKGKVSLKSYRGKVVYLDFWASWCPPCRKAMPAIEKMRKSYPADQFVVVAVNVDKDLKKARKIVAKERIGYVSGSDPGNKLPGRYKIKTMPTSYLLDKNGVIRYVHEGYRRGDDKKLREEVEKLLRESKGKK